LTSVDVQTVLQRPRKVAARMIPVFAVTWYLFARAVKILPKSSQKAIEKQSKQDLSAVRKIPVASSQKYTEKQPKRYRGAVKKIPFSCQQNPSPLGCLHGCSARAANMRQLALHYDKALLTLKERGRRRPWQQCKGE